MTTQDFGDLADTINTQHPLPWRARGSFVLDANGKLVVVCSAATAPYSNATMAQFVAAAANLAVVGEVA